MNETIFFVALLVAGTITTLLGLTRLRAPSVTHENRAEIARAYFDHVTGKE